MKKPIFIGIAGGTGSGKSTIAKEIYGQFDGDCIAMIEHDAYYKDQSNIPFEERIKTNYDHPNALETTLLIEHLRQLASGKAIEKPIYDFAQHTRLKETINVEARDIVIVEGIMILDDPELRDLLDIKIYVDTDADVRIIRRMVRDINERGRTVDSVIEQYLNVVRPMHMQFVEPSKKFADIIIPEGGHNRVAIDVMASNIRHILQCR
ncbi:uridine kinase [Clostridium frigidicarnis]|uniref:Uridine kinase n=1 Tax=Clostridium frigidicarnis TaxID=84698 RepID=A0A1I0VMQ5_9CLOT|nr:uridine kinase [Clostridium frigidicarnis]SFA77704.1 uridine kinase [Clostridium frigidicarnis]